LERLEQLAFVKKAVLESRVIDLSEEKIIELRKVFSRQLEIPVGFETANPTIRDLCINKTFSNETFEIAVAFCKKHDVNIIPLMIFKPPFLTEKEAIVDYFNSLQYLDPLRLKRIDMEILTIERDTLAELLWKKGQFHTPWFWSVIDTLTRKAKAKLETPLYISPISYSVKAESMPSNCSQCDPLILERFHQYNQSGDVRVFDDIACECKKKWEKEIQARPDIESLPLRVSTFLGSYTQKT
jgi:hypothetical protein